MTRYQLRKKCIAEKIKGYRLLRVGEITAGIAIVAALTGLLLGNKDIITFQSEMFLILMGAAFALIGIILYFIGEAIAIKAVKSSGYNEIHRKLSKVKPQRSFTLENQNGRIEKFSDADICNYLDEMFITPDQFVTLTAPKVKGKVRFVQACMQGKSVMVQLGLEEKENRLVEKLCSKEECTRIFLAFYKGEFIPNQHEYQEVKF